MPVRASSDRPARARAPGVRGGSEAKAEARDRVPQLQLAVSRFGLGLELSEPYETGALRVERLSAPLLGLSFPVDLSGGVPRFRHRRGTLESLALTILREPVLAELSRALASADRKPHVQLLPASHGLTVGIAERDAAVAFELVWVPRGRDAELVVCEARSVGHAGPAQLTALLACDTALGKLAVRRGSRFLVSDVPGLVLRTVLPSAGARVPSTEDVALSEVEATQVGFTLRAEHGGRLPALHGTASRALELAALTEAADDALVAGQLEQARTAMLSALERAPSHPELATRLADLDRALGRRGETAMATLSTAGLAVDAGPLGAELLEAVGDTHGAREAWERTADREPFSALGALALVRAARLTDDPRDRDRLLTAAHVRSPSTDSIVWTLLDAALERGDTQRVLRLTDELVARARGPHEKQRVLVRLGQKLADARLVREAKDALERALRYEPTDPETLNSLGRCLFDLGEGTRAADVLSRALAAMERKKVDTSPAELLLAKVLAEALGDLPLAVARLRRLPRSSAVWAEARHHEARHLVTLGDHAAASVVWEAMQRALFAEGPAKNPAAWTWLAEAARFELDVRDDKARAKLHAQLALEMRPRDAAIRELFRRAAEEPRRAEDPHRAVRASLDESPTEARHPERRDATEPPPAPIPSEPPPGDDLDVEARVDALTASLRAAPGDLAVAVELATLLDRHERDLELFALTSARLEEGDDTTRRVLEPFHRAALSRLADSAEREGRPADAALYRSMVPPSQG